MSTAQPAPPKTPSNRRRLPKPQTENACASPCPSSRRSPIPTISIRCNVEPSVDFTFVMPGTPLPQRSDLIILPGSKATLADLRFVEAQGWDIDLRAHLRQGGAVLGICGGYQMLGRSVSDPAGLEGIRRPRRRLEPARSRHRTSGDRRRPVTGTARSRARASTAMKYMSAVPTAPRPRAPSSISMTAAWTVPSTAAAMCSVLLHGLFADDAMRASVTCPSRQLQRASPMTNAVEVVSTRCAAAMETHLEIDAMLAIAALRRSILSDARPGRSCSPAPARNMN